MVRLAFAILLLAVGACALFATVPENICRGDSDCFQAQGEFCNLETKRCEPRDGGVPVDAAIDAPPVD